MKQPIQWFIMFDADLEDRGASTHPEKEVAVEWSPVPSGLWKLGLCHVWEYIFSLSGFIVFGVLSQDDVWVSL